MHNDYIVIEYILIVLLMWAVVFLAHKTTELVFKYIKYIKGSKQKCCGELCPELKDKVKAEVEAIARQYDAKK